MGHWARLPSNAAAQTMRKDMHKKTARALGVALFLGAAALTAGLVVPTTPAEAAAITNRAVGVPLQEAQQLAARGQLTQAIAKAREARAGAGITNAETILIDRLIAAWMLQARDYRGALTAYESLADRGVDRERSLQAALGAAMQINNMAKVQELAAKMPGGAGNADLFIAQGLYSSKRYREAIAKAQPFAQRNPPSQQALEIMGASYFGLNDVAGRRTTLETLVTHYPTAERWSNLLRMARNERGLTDAQQLDIFRIRLLLGDLKTAEDYMEMAQLALIAGYPAEAKSVVEKGAAAKLLTGERTQRLAALVTQRLAEDQRVAAQLPAQAAADRTGNADVKLGLSMLSYGKAAEAEAALRQAVTEGGGGDKDAAQIGLGRALLAQGKKPDAVRAFGAVPRTSKSASVARLWSIYAQRS
jgi:tetratricopeptide (TPR) repeat protein